MFTPEWLLERLDWTRIRDFEPEGLPSWRCVSLQSDHSPSIDFLFVDFECTCMQQLGFGEWHAHYDQFDDESKNMRRAVATAATLIAQRRCLLEQRDAKDNYIGSVIVRTDELPLSLSANVHHLRRCFFDRPPLIEQIDFNRYAKTKHSFVEHEHLAKLREVYAGTDAAQYFE